MSSPHYIGNSPTYGQFVQQTISASGVGPHTLVQRAPSAESLLVVQSGVVLKPSTDYTIGSSGSQITFAAGKAPAAGNTWILFQGQSLLNASTAAVEIDSFVGDSVDTTFDVTSLPASPDNLAVFVDGILQSYTTNWTLAGTTITFTSAPDTSSAIDVYHFKVSFAGTWLEIPSSVSAFDAVVGAKYLVTAPGGGTTIALPGTPSVGDEVQIRNTSANSISVTAAVNIAGSASPYAGITAHTGKTFVYAGTYGWSVE